MHARGGGGGGGGGPRDGAMHINKTTSTDDGDAEYRNVAELETLALSLSLSRSACTSDRHYRKLKRLSVFRGRPKFASLP